MSEPTISDHCVAFLTNPQMAVVATYAIAGLAAHFDALAQPWQKKQLCYCHTSRFHSHCKPSYQILLTLLIHTSHWTQLIPYHELRLHHFCHWCQDFLPHICQILFSTDPSSRGDHYQSFPTNEEAASPCHRVSSSLEMRRKHHQTQQHRGHQAQDETSKPTSRRSTTSQSISEDRLEALGQSS